ncbi:MAG: RNA polymerase factor sigma-54 [Bacteroidetes bacterium]|nr:RNA polymerase factor sigma-54 [Bacteroidota bacterium]
MLHLTQTQKLQQRLSPAQVQYLKILQLPVIQLEQKIKDELELNPLLEEGMEMEEEQDERLDMLQDAKVEDATEVPTDEEVAPPERVKESSDDTMDKEIREHSDEEYSWEEFFENNEGSSSTTQYWDEDDGREAPTPATVTFRERISEQIQMLDLTETELLLADAILWNIDDDGYLHADFSELLHDFNLENEIDLSMEAAESVLHKLQRLDPPGIGSRSLRECLLVQLELMPNVSTPRIIALRILREAYESFEKKHFDKLMQELHISQDMLKRAFDVIRTLNPKPGEGDGVVSVNYIIPDFFVHKEDGEFIITLNDRGVPPLRVNRAYKEMLLNQRKRISTETRHFLRQKMEAAKWFIQSIHQRRNTMLAVMHSIVEKQTSWFEKGQGYLRPLIYKDIAEDIEMDISTISRVVNGKYVQTEWGVFELRYFFSEGISTDDGEEVANKEVMAIMKDIIDVEDPRKPLSDQALTKILQDRGFNIARRTVAKYRESMDIPVSRLRKRLV